MELDLVQIGQIINTHGIRGEVKVLPLTSDVTLFSKAKLYLGRNEQDSAIKTVQFESMREHKNALLLKFTEIPDLNAALLLVKQCLFVEAKDLLPLEEEEFFIHELYNAKVYSTDKEYLGIVTHFQEIGEGGVCKVEKDGTFFLFPTSKEVFLDFNREEKIITIQILEGLLDLNKKK